MTAENIIMIAASAAAVAVPIVGAIVWGIKRLYTSGVSQGEHAVQHKALWHKVDEHTEKLEDHDERLSTVETETAGSRAMVAMMCDDIKFIKDYIVRQSSGDGK